MAEKKKKVTTAKVDDKEKNVVEITQEEAEEMLRKIKEPIYLKTPLNYQAGEVVITELSEAERDQIMFKFITNITAYLEKSMLILNDLLLLSMENSRRNGVNVRELLNKSVIKADKQENTNTMQDIKNLKENK